MKTFLAIIGATMLAQAGGTAIRDYFGGWQKMDEAPNYGTIEIRPVGFFGVWSSWSHKFTYQQAYPDSCTWGWWRIEDGNVIGIIDSELNRYRWRLPKENKGHD